jgi:hypothetical protein
MAKSFEKEAHEYLHKGLGPAQSGIDHRDHIKDYHAFLGKYGHKAQHADEHILKAVAGTNTVAGAKRALGSHPAFFGGAKGTTPVAPGAHPFTSGTAHGAPAASAPRGASAPREASAPRGEALRDKIAAVRASGSKQMSDHAKEMTNKAYQSPSAETHKAAAEAHQAAARSAPNDVQALMHMSAANNHIAKGSAAVAASAKANAATAAQQAHDKTAMTTGHTQADRDKAVELHKAAKEAHEAAAHHSSGNDSATMQQHVQKSYDHKNAISQIKNMAPIPHAAGGADAKAGSSIPHPANTGAHSNEPGGHMSAGAPGGGSIGSHGSAPVSAYGKSVPISNKGQHQESMLDGPHGRGQGTALTTQGHSPMAHATMAARAAVVQTHAEGGWRAHRLIKSSGGAVQAGAPKPSGHTTAGTVAKAAKAGVAEKKASGWAAWRASIKK